MATNPNLPVATASVACTDGAGDTTLRVYSSDGYNVTERMTISTGWVDGPLSVPGNAISAISWTNSEGVYVRVYCTDADSTTEWCLDPGATTYYEGQYTLS